MKISNFVKFQIFVFLIFRCILSRMTPAGSTAVSASSSPCFSLILRRFLRSNLSNFLCPVLVCATSKRGYSRLSGPPQKTLPRPLYISGYSRVKLKTLRQVPGYFARGWSVRTLDYPGRPRRSYQHGGSTRVDRGDDSSNPKAC